MRIARGADLLPKPWRNGRGITRDILAAPGGEADWLVSIADLERDAPFSHFPHADRLFTIVSGDAVRFRFEDGEELDCPPFVPILFSGDRALQCHLTGGQARAFNVVVDRRRFTASVTAMRLTAGHPVRLAAGTTTLFCAAGRIRLGDETLEAGDTGIGEVATIAAEDGPATAVRVAVVTLSR